MLGSVIYGAHLATGVLSRGLCGVNGSFDSEFACCIQPPENFAEEFFDGLTAVVSGDGLVQMPPDSLNRICFRCVFWQEVERKRNAAITPAGKADFRLVGECLREAWSSSWQGKDSLHEMAFGEPRE